MSTAGPNAPGTVSATWTNYANVAASDNAYATVYRTSVGNVAALQVTNFGFAIPSGATIDGVTVAIERKASSNNAYAYIWDNSLKLIKGGSVSGDNKGATTTKWPTSDGTASYGGVSDKWGNTLADTDVNANNFGVELIAYAWAGGKTPVTAYVDHITITITYTEGGGGASAVPVIMNQYRQRRM